jgi:hypothetical protein
MFMRSGRFVYAARWAVLAGSRAFAALATTAVGYGVVPSYKTQPPVEVGQAPALINHGVRAADCSFGFICRIRILCGHRAGPQTSMFILASRSPPLSTPPLRHSRLATHNLMEGATDHFGRGA